MLYRRWAGQRRAPATLLSRGALLIAARDIGCCAATSVPSSPGGRAAVTTPQAALYPVIVGVMAHDHEFAHGFRSTVVVWRREAMRVIYERAAARGEVDPALPIDLVSELGQAVLWHRLLITGDLVDEAFIDRLLDEVVMPLSLAGGPGGAPAAP